MCREVWSKIEPRHKAQCVSRRVSCQLEISQANSFKYIQDYAFIATRPMPNDPDIATHASPYVETQSDARPLPCPYDDRTTPSTPSHEPTSTFSTEPTETIDAKRARLVRHLDSTDQPFNVNTIPVSRKRKRRITQPQRQDDLFEPRLAVEYKVEPVDIWESLQRYKRFTCKGTHAIGGMDHQETVLTNGESSGIPKHCNR